MTQRQRITITQTQRLQLNLGLHAAIRLLRADAAGLTAYLEEQAAENPVLKVGPAPLPAAGDWLPRWGQVLGGASNGSYSEQAREQAREQDREQASARPSLIAHVMAALDGRMQGKAQSIAVALTEALEPSGWMTQPLVDIARVQKVSVKEVEAVLRQLQKIEPAGLFARDLAECLRLQAREEGALDAVMAVMLDHLDLLAAGDFARLAQLARTDTAQIAQRFRVIRAMNPKPGTAFDVLAMPHHREPDLTVRRGDGGWQVALNRSSLPALHIDTAGASDRVSAAKAVLRMVEARNTTLLRVASEILRRQEAALSQGVAALVPMTMAELAVDLDLHESTISRVVAGTSVDTPLGVWWLRLLFSRGVGDGQVSAAAIRERLARLVADEPPSAPLSDEALAAALSVDGAQVARRTVAKYRAVLQIAPAHRRKRR